MDQTLKTTLKQYHTQLTERITAVNLLLEIEAGPAQLGLPFQTTERKAWPRAAKSKHHQRLVTHRNGEPTSIMVVKDFFVHNPNVKHDNASLCLKLGDKVTTKSIVYALGKLYRAGFLSRVDRGVYMRKG